MPRRNFRFEDSLLLVALTALVLAGGALLVFALL